MANVEMEWPEGDTLDLSNPIDIKWTWMPPEPIDNFTLTNMDLGIFYRHTDNETVHLYKFQNNVSLSDEEYEWDPTEFTERMSALNITLAGEESHYFQLHLWRPGPNGTKTGSDFLDSDNYAVEGYDDIADWASTVRPAAWGYLVLTGGALLAAFW